MVDSPWALATAAPSCATVMGRWASLALRAVGARSIDERGESRCQRYAKEDYTFAAPRSSLEIGARWHSTSRYV